MMIIVGTAIGICLPLVIMPLLMFKLAEFGNNQTMKSLKPIFIENSVIPKILSFLAPIRINAIALFPFVFSRSKMFPSTKRHESIHFQQQLETLVLGFYFFYLFDFLRNLSKGQKARDAYLNIRAEKEARENQHTEDYLDSRRRWQWLKEDQ